VTVAAPSDGALAPRNYYWTSRNRPDPFEDIDLGDFDVEGDKE